MSEGKPSVDGTQDQGGWGRYLRPAAIALVVVVGLLVVLGDRADDGSGPDNGSAAEPSRMTELTVESRELDLTMPVNVIVPAKSENDAAGGTSRGALLFLHGRGSNQESVVTPEFYDALRAHGSNAPVVILPFGGESSYYHDRADGDWERYLVFEVLDQVADVVPFDRDAVAVGGISMGGFGALNVASEYPAEFCAVGAHSPAIFMSAGETAEGAFDDAADFDDHDLVTRFADGPAGLGQMPIWMDIGSEDPFLAGTRAVMESLAEGGADIVYNIWPGGHNDAYWNANWDSYFDFYVDRIDGCRGVAAAP